MKPTAFGTGGLRIVSRCQIDVIVEYFIANGKYDIFEINEVLFEYDQPLLGGGYFFMAYIPIEHQKYDILPLCRQYGGEAFSYSTELENKIDRLLPDGESVIPYGYASYEQFEQHVDYYISKYGVVGNSLNQLGNCL